MKEISFFKSIIISTGVFAISAVISSLIGKMIITDTVYFALSADNSAAGFADRISALKNASEASLSQLLILSLSGFSALSLAASSAVSMVRGVTFGYCTAIVERGVVSAAAFLPIGICYAFTSVAVIIYTAVTVSFSSSIRENGLKVGQVSKYIAVFFTFSGIAVLSDGARLLFV